MNIFVFQKYVTEARHCEHLFNVSFKVFTMNYMKFILNFYHLLLKNVYHYVGFAFNSILLNKILDISLNNVSYKPFTVFIEFFCINLGQSTKQNIVYTRFSITSANFVFILIKINWSFSSVFSDVKGQLTSNSYFFFLRY